VQSAFALDDIQNWCRPAQSKADFVIFRHWKKHEWRYQDLATAVQDVWAFAMVFAGMANVHWRLVVVKCGKLTHAEVKGKCRMSNSVVCKRRVQLQRRRSRIAILVGKQSAKLSKYLSQLAESLCLRNSTSDIALQQDGQVDVFSHRQILALAERDPFWISPLCSVLTSYSDQHVNVGTQKSDCLCRHAQQEMYVQTGWSEALRALGIHRWHFEDTTPLPAHLHAVQLEQTRAPHRSNA
jgi:hypothetical protein